MPFPSPGDLPNSGMEPMFLGSPSLAGGFFTTSATWEVLSRICTAFWFWVLFFEAFHSFILEISSTPVIKSERQLRVCSNMGKSGLCSQLYRLSTQVTADKPLNLSLPHSLTCVTGTLIPAGRSCPLHGGCDQEEAEAWGS